MIDLSQETPVSLADAPASFPGRPHISSVWRWVGRGVRNVRLETFSVGAKRYTTAQAIKRFIVATTAAAGGTPAPTRTPKQRQRDIDRAEAELRAAGV